KGILDRSVGAGATTARLLTNGPVQGGRRDRRAGLLERPNGSPRQARVWAGDWEVRVLEGTSWLLRCRPGRLERSIGTIAVRLARLPLPSSLRPPEDPVQLYDDTP